MKFTKMHGLGNDYVFVDLSRETVADPSTLARLMSCRHTGVGADGLILIDASAVGDARMVMYNTDGSRARMCGNGLRCVAKYVVERGMAPGPRLRIETDAGIRSCICQLRAGRVVSVRVDMGVPSWRASDLPASLSNESLIDHVLEAKGEPYTVTAVSMGNPHAVMFVEDPDSIELNRIGPVLENHPIFPDRINVHVARVDARDRVTMRCWERGTGETNACGTGACAVCVAGALTHRTDRDIVATLPGGELAIEWSSDDHVHMTGPAVEVFSGEWAM